MEGLPIDTSHPAVRDYLALVRYVFIRLFCVLIL